MTKPLRELIGIIANTVSVPKKVVEVGSRQAVNQEDIADLRGFFKGASFIGVDMEAGPGVDQVQKGESLPFADSSLELVLCLETFEHCDKPWEVAKEIERVVSKKGIVVVSSQQNFPIHMHPSDYFRYTPFGLKSLFPTLKSKLVVTISPPFDSEVSLNPQHVILIGTKESNPQLLTKIKKEITKNKSKISVHKPYRHRLFDAWKFFLRGLNEFKFRQEVEFF
jgi:SAM-dependent methyltransferase